MMMLLEVRTGRHGRHGRRVPWRLVLVMVRRYTVATGRRRRKEIADAAGVERPRHATTSTVRSEYSKMTAVPMLLLLLLLLLLGVVVVSAATIVATTRCDVAAAFAAVPSSPALPIVVVSSAGISYFRRRRCQGGGEQTPFVCSSSGNHSVTPYVGDGLLKGDVLFDEDSNMMVSFCFRVVMMQFFICRLVMMSSSKRAVRAFDLANSDEGDVAVLTT